MNLTFAQPMWLLLTLLAIPVIVTGVRWFSAMSTMRMWSAVITRSILIALIACILAGAASVRTSSKLAVIAVVDVSDSVRQFSELRDLITDRPTTYPLAIRQWLEEATLDQSAEDLFGLVVFDGRSLAIATPRAGGHSDFAVEYHAAQGTNIEDALEFAEALIPPGAARRLVLITDGVQTSGDAMRAAERLAAGGTDTGDSIPVDVLPINYEVQREVMIESVDSPPRSATGSTVAVRVVFNSTHEVSGRLELLYEGAPLDLNGPLPGTGRRLTLKRGRDFAIVQAPLDESAKVHRFEPVFVPDDERDDQIASNNRTETFTITPGRGEVLLLDGAAINDG